MRSVMFSLLMVLASVTVAATPCAAQTLSLSGVTVMNGGTAVPTATIHTATGQTMNAIWAVPVGKEMVVRFYDAAGVKVGQAGLTGEDDLLWTVDLPAATYAIKIGIADVGVEPAAFSNCGSLVVH